VPRPRGAIGQQAIAFGCPALARSGRRRWAGPEGCRPGAGAGPRRSGCGWRSSRIRPDLPGSERLTVSRERPHSTGVESATHTSSLRTEVVVARIRLTLRIRPAALRSRCCSGLLGQVGEEVAQVRTGTAEPAGDAPSACRRSSHRLLSRGCPRRSSKNDLGHPRSRLRRHPLDHTARRNQCHPRNCSPPRRSSPTRRSC
jgi:hypothetical protein